jgi:uncharacterized SAM-binding protein YcdF (DUF218 family)
MVAPFELAQPDRRRDQMARAARIMISGTGAMTAALIFGFVLFAVAVTRDAREAAGDRKADGIVVFTGGGKRLPEAMRLLDNGLATRLLISGVNRRTSRDDVRRLVTPSGNGAPGAGTARAFDCCVDIGYDALDTIGNADEARTWATTWRFSSLIVVTASNHMPRSLAELRLALPDVRLIPHAVVPGKLKGGPWWLHADAVKELATEYLKFLPTAARYGVVQLIRIGEGQPPMQASKAVRGQI